MLFVQTVRKYLDPVTFSENVSEITKELAILTILNMLYNIQKYSSFTVCIVQLSCMGTKAVTSTYLKTIDIPTFQLNFFYNTPTDTTTTFIKNGTFRKETVEEILEPIYNIENLDELNINIVYSMPEDLLNKVNVNIKFKTQKGQK